MPLHFQAYRETLAELGVELSPEDYYRNVGGTARETIPRFLRGRTVSCSIEELHARKQTRVTALLAHATIPQLATAALLPLLDGRVPMAIASSGSRSAIDLVLQRLEWSLYFGAGVTGADVPHGKPAPDLFLRAAQLLGVAPPRCLAFEDTDDGVESARRAGMSVVDVRNAAASSAALIRRVGGHT
jgi:HAD superfamily hydrolase (TIGR01509 family)